MILFKMRIRYFLFDGIYILFGGSDEIYSFEMHQFFRDIFDLLNEINIIFIQF